VGEHGEIDEPDNFELQMKTLSFQADASGNAPDSHRCLRMGLYPLASGPVAKVTQ
jgi:hypothetical protein